MSAWQPVCTVEQLPVDRGVAALIDGEQVALFRLSDGSMHAIANRDPFSGAMVLSRGIVGSRGEVATVASPLYKQVFDLATGVCLDDESVQVPTYPVRLHESVVELALATEERQLA